MLVSWRREEPESAGRLKAQPADDLFPLPAKHTLEREEQQQEKWINVSRVKLPQEALGQHCFFSFVIMLYISVCPSFVFPISVWLDYCDFKVNLKVQQNCQLS